MTLRNTLLNQPIQEKYQESQLEESDSYQLPLNNSDLLISVIIPVYNEENSIKDVIDRIPNHHNYEIILIDDGSTDKSVLKIKEINNRLIKIISHEKNIGYGAALKTGFKQANGAIIVTLDSDAQHNPEEIPNLIKPIIKEEADLVIGSRYLGSADYKIPLLTRLGEFMIKLCLKYLYGQEVGNNQSGFRAFKRELLKSFIEINNNGMAFSTELLLKAMEAKKKILEIPIDLGSRKFGSSYVNLFKIAKSILSCVILYTLKRFKITRIILKKIIPHFQAIFKIIIRE